jgi:hypothetical protein
LVFSSLIEREEEKMNWFRSVFFFLKRYFYLVFKYHFKYKKVIKKMFPLRDYSITTNYEMWNKAIGKTHPFPFGLFFSLSWLPSRYRTSTQFYDVSFDVPSDTGGYVFILSLVALSFWGLKSWLYHPPDPADMDPMEYAASMGVTPQVMIDNMIRSTAEVLLVTKVVEMTGTPTPIPFQTSTPFYTPTVTPTPQVEIYQFSFYDPMIGRYFPGKADTNCADWRINKYTGVGNCHSDLSNGEPFKEWYGKGVACPPGLSLGQRFMVLSPEPLAGEWECVDRGAGIEDRLLDFLLPFPSHPMFAQSGWDLDKIGWRQPVELYFLYD